MTQHSNYTVAGVNGTLNDGGVSDSRKIGIRFNMLTDCNFVSGSSFSYKASASSRCGNPANGSNVIYNTSGIDIDGTSDDYDVSLNLFKANGSSGSFDNCGGQVTLQGSYQVTTSGSAGVNPYINIQLPLGMSYVSGSFTPINSSGASYNGVSNLASGEEVVRIDVPGSLNSGDVVEYAIQVEDGGQNYLSCGDHAIKMVSIDESNSVSCGSSVNCPSVRIETGNFDFNFTIDKAGVELSSLTTSSIMNGSNEDITAVFEVSNTHSNFAINSGLIVEAYFDANSNGVIDAGDTPLGTRTLANGIPSGASVSESISFTASPNQVCNILLAITHENNRCICNEAVVPMNIPANLELIAGDDKNACSVNDLVTIGQANNT